MKTFSGIAILALGAMLGLSACGGGATTSTDGGASDAGGSADLTVKTLDTFSYDPNAWTVSAGQEVNLTLDNAEGLLEHSFVVLNEGLTRDDALTITPDGQAEMKYYSLVVPIGGTESGTFTAPATPGEYVVVCAVAGHAAGGMMGTLTVQ
jgi:uncharacterized cupredoxin-like copper-binding protein